MSRPSRIHDRRASSRRRPVDSATAVARPPARPGGSRTTRSVSDRRASAASRPSRSAIRAGLSVAASRPPGRSRTSRSTERPASSAPRDGQALVERGRGDDDEPLEPDAAGDRLDRVEAARRGPARPRSSPGAWASAASRRTRVVRPLEPSPRMATLAERGQAAGPEDRVERREPGVDDAVVGSGRARGRGLARVRTGARLAPIAGARASAPSVTRGAAAPQRAWRLATAAVTSGERVAIGRS